MKKFKEENGVQLIFSEATEADFYGRRALQEEFYGELEVHEDESFLEFHTKDCEKSSGLSSHVTLSYVKATGMLHVPYLYSTFKLV